MFSTGTPACFIISEWRPVMTTIIDYGAGNLHSVKNALNSLGEKTLVTKEKEQILNAERLVLPGVGAFGDAMQKLNESGLTEVIREYAKSGKPFMGICLGLQLMFEESEETEGVKGLGIFKGKCVKIPKSTDIKIPHMGWNSLEPAKESKVLRNIGDEPYVYFVHSYYIQPEDESVVSAYTTYGERIAVAAEKDNVFALQFHPEKSSKVGMQILRNFIETEAL